MPGCPFLVSESSRSKIHHHLSVIIPHFISSIIIIQPCPPCLVRDMKKWPKKLVNLHSGSGKCRFWHESDAANSKNCDPSPSIKGEGPNMTVEWRSNEAHFAGSAAARKEMAAVRGSQPAKSLLLFSVCSARPCHYQPSAAVSGCTCTLSIICTLAAPCKQRWGWSSFSLTAVNSQHVGTCLLPVVHPGGIYLVCGGGGSAHLIIQLS